MSSIKVVVAVVAYHALENQFIDNLLIFVYVIVIWLSHKDWELPNLRI